MNCCALSSITPRFSARVRSWMRADIETRVRRLSFHRAVPLQTDCRVRLTNKVNSLGTKEVTERR